MAKKNISIAPFIQAGKKENSAQYRSMSALNKRAALQIRQQIAARFAEFSDKIIDNLTETIPLGYYVDGGYVGVLGNELKFQSKIDQFQYKQSQVKYRWSLFSTRTAAALNPDGSSFVMGQFVEPLQAAVNSGAGEILWINCRVEQATGAVICEVSYRLEASGVETPTNDGIIWVEALCSRYLT